MQHKLILLLHGPGATAACALSEQPYMCMQLYTHEAQCTAGGGEGMGAIEATVAAIKDRVGAGCQLVVVCGRNKKLMARLEAK